VLCKSRYLGWQTSCLGLQVYQVLAGKLVVSASKFFLLSLGVKCSPSFVYIIEEQPIAARAPQPYSPKNSLPLVVQLLRVGTRARVRYWEKSTSSTHWRVVTTTAAEAHGARITTTEAAAQQTAEMARAAVTAVEVAATVVVALHEGARPRGPHRRRSISPSTV
jgi:hypothetical protein